MHPWFGQRAKKNQAVLPSMPRLMQIVHHRNPYSALLGRGPASYSHHMVTPKKTAIITGSTGDIGTSNRVPTKEDFDWLYCEMTGFMRTQILAVAASLRLAEHLQDGGRTAENFAAFSGIEPSMAFRFLRACTKIGLTACDDGRTFKSTSRLQALHGETPGSMRNKAMVFGRQCARTKRKPPERWALRYSTITLTIQTRPRSFGRLCRTFPRA